MDELFLLPPTPVALPRAYWLDPRKNVLGSHLMLIQPSTVEFARIQDEINKAGPDDYDMEIMNHLYGETATIIPHRPYSMLTSEFRSHQHAAYLGSDTEEWDPVAAYNEVKYVHFSDWPVPKPFVPPSPKVWKEQMPRCETKGEIEDCSARDIWVGLYSEFKDLEKVRLSLGS